MHKQIYQIYQSFRLLNESIQQLSQSGWKTRRMIFPEVVSEFCVFKILEPVAKIRPALRGGDLEEYINGSYRRIEVKCYCGRGPTSFGPTEIWEKLYIFHVKNEQFILYCIPLANTDVQWQNVQMSKKETFRDQANQGRRPRILIPQLLKQVPYEIIATGNIDDILIK